MAFELQQLLEVATQLEERAELLEKRLAKLEATRDADRFYPSWSQQNDARYVSYGQSNVQTALNLSTATHNAKWFGAVGDGVTDDSTAIQTAVDTAYASGGGVVRLPAGIYRLGTRLNLKQGVRIVGDGIEATTIRSTLSGILVAFQALVDGQELIDMWLEHLTVDGVSTANGGTGIALIPEQVTGVGADSCRLCGIRSVRTKNLSTGLHLYNTQQFNIDSCKFQSCTNGVFFTVDEPNTGVPQLVRFSHCDFRANTNGIKGTYVAGSKAYFWYLENCHFEINTAYGVDVNGAAPAFWTFSSCKFEQNGTGALDITGAEGFSFFVCYFNANSSGSGSQVSSIQASPNSGGGHVFQNCSWFGTGSVKDLRLEFVPRVLLDCCQLSSGGITNVRSDIKQVNAYRSAVKSPSVVTQHRVAVWIDFTQTGTNFVGIYPKSANDFTGNTAVWIDRVQIHVTTAFARTGGTQTVIRVGDEAGEQAISASQDVETTGIKTPTMNTTGYAARGASYFAVTLFTDGTLSAGKALVLVDYSEVPVQP